LKTIAAQEEKTGKRIDADVITWRGMMTKVKLLNPLMPMVNNFRSCPPSSVIGMGKFDWKCWVIRRLMLSCSFEMNATLFQVSNPFEELDFG